MFTSSLRFVPALAAVLLAGALPAAASTLSEADVAGGDFSSLWYAPTVVGNGYDTITGTGSGNNYDIFALTGMASGPQTVTLDLQAPEGIGWSYAAGGNVLYSTAPFRWGWDGTMAGVFMSSFLTPSSSFSLTLGPDFAGTLYLALYFTYGQNLAYTLGVPGNAAPAAAATTAAVPLPATAALLGGALAGFAAFSRRGRRRAA